MKPLDEIPEDSVLDEIAAEWLCERESGFTPERARAFATWCARDVRHKDAVQRIESTLALLDEMPAVRSELHARLGGKLASDEHPRPEPRRLVAFRQWAWGGGIAAALLLGLVLWWNVGRPTGPVDNYITDTQAQRTLALADGSVLDLNVASQVSVQFRPHERRVTLLKGEAHFQVAHNAGRPFIVTAGDVSVRAVGTAFEVKLTPEAVDVVVVEGRVELGRSTAKLALPGAGAAPLISAGERVQMPRSTGNVAPRIEQMDARSIHSLLTWKTPMTSFTDVPLRDVITRFNRWNGTQLVLEDVELGQRKIGGKIALDQVDAFVRLLEQDGDIVADRTTSGRIGLRRAR